MSADRREAQPPLTFSPNARLILEARYLQKDTEGHVVETPEAMFRRVARTIAEADRAYEGAAAAQFEEQVFEAMANALFLPNSPALMNAGTPLGQLAACFVLPVDDSIPSIFGALREMAIIQQTGGGTGFSFSRLRPKGDPVRETGGIASGPVSFLRVFDVATEVIKLGGRRRGANMAVLRADHPDILDFVTAKELPGALTNFNLSVALPDSFADALTRAEQWPLVNPRTGQPTGKIPARELWDALCAAAWRTGDPGLLFIDEINRHNPTPALGPLEATNPCGEAPLLPYEACILGSINLARLVVNGTIDWERLDQLTRLGVRALDDLIDASRFPLPEIEARAHATRKIGLGVMGFADLLCALGVPYASPEAVALAGTLMARIQAVARDESIALGRRRGPFPACAESIWPARGIPVIRNATLTTIAPTGTLSILAGTSSGIEPIFALVYARTALDGAELEEVHPLFVQALEAARLPVASLIARAAETGSIQQFEEIPEPIRRRFATALDIPPEWHVRVQAAFQRFTDNGVSKTVNLPAEATIDDVAAVFRLAWQLRCKGVTVFRSGSRPAQVLHIVAPALGIPRRVEAEFSGECRHCPN
ncbi:MAG: adenosylcobalamin-dependent ribonucleoside-diphosphate reductase [Chloroflexota bacterium]|nr:adenosylcobalamin-dependent ribonucleoside-diphosphate reductase [Dehalococcoidia bacterium]MDW8252500.1 adenosylcobalamin-dependent ribonucleoside-diphosphate reductase [Chloroflexota bacterium]